jgi:hypothetical protein
MFRKKYIYAPLLRWLIPDVPDVPGKWIARPVKLRVTLNGQTSVFLTPHALSFPVIAHNGEWVVLDNGRARYALPIKDARRLGLQLLDRAQTDVIFPATAASAAQTYLATCPMCGGTVSVDRRAYTIAPHNRTDTDTELPCPAAGTRHTPQWDAALRPGEKQ